VWGVGKVFCGVWGAFALRKDDACNGGGDGDGNGQGGVLAFGRAVAPLARVLIGTVETVPFRVCGFV
jgi:hypothetical protein